MIVNWRLFTSRLALFAATVGSLNVTATAQPGQPPRTAIVLDFTNHAGSRYDSLIRTATDSVAVELAKSDRFELLKRSEVDRQAKELDLRPPLDQIARTKLAAALPSTTQILRGSLLHRRIRHRSGCAVCARGKGHLVWVLTVSYPGGRTKQISLSAEQKPLVQQWLRNYRKLKATLERICELNHKLLRPENHR